MTSSSISALAGASLLTLSSIVPSLAADPRPVDSMVAESKDSGTLDRANPEMRLAIEQLIALGAKPVQTLSVDEARSQPTPADAAKKAIEITTGKPAVPEAVAKTEDVKVKGAAGELDARVYWPAGAADGAAMPLIVYFHGGGWVIANLDVYDASPRALANQAKAVVVSVHYRQGPEDRFPAAHDDAVAAYADIVENAGKWNADPERVAIVGESAGGGLAVDTAIAARDQKLTLPDAVVAVYPIAGSDMNTPSYIANQNAVPLGKGGMGWFFENYLTGDDAKDPRIDIVGAADLSGLPPVTIIGAEIDPLNSDGTLLRDKLMAAGVEVTYQNWNGVTHEFFGMTGAVPEAKQAQDMAGAQLRKAFE